MDYFRLYIGDFLADTQEHSMADDGAYFRLLMFCYTKEAPLPLDVEKIYDIARAKRPKDREAVRIVLAAHFTREHDGYHNKRADKEMAIAVPRIETLRRVARENGAKSKGRPKKPGTLGDPVDKPGMETGSGSQPITESGSIQKPDPEPNPVPTRDVGQPPSANHQPKSKSPSEKRFPGRDTTPDSAGGFGAAALRELQPPGPEANVRAADETPAGMLAAVCQRNGITAHAFHPLVVEWARDGFTVDQLKAAIATARMPQRKGDGTIPLAYLDPILRDAAAGKPKAASWKTDDEAAKALCHELGIKPAKTGETREEWHRRIESAVVEHSRRRVA